MSGRQLRRLLELLASRADQYADDHQAGELLNREQWEALAVLVIACQLAEIARDVERIAGAVESLGGRK